MERLSEKASYYDLLGVAATATDQEIKQAYRKLAIKYHPDKNSDDDEEIAEANFKTICEAYEVLADTEKRAAFDQFGTEGLRQGMGGGVSQEQAMEIFKHFFG